MSVIFVVLIPLLMAAILVSLWNVPKGRKVIAIIGSGAHALAGAWLLTTVLQAGAVAKNISGWIPPFGIEFRADLFSATLVALASFIGLCVTIYAHSNIDDERTNFGFHPLFFVLLGGISGAFVTADLFNMFVWFECILLSSFVLLGLGGEKKQLRGSLNYVIPNLFSSMLFLSGLGLIYGATGTLNMAQLAERTAQINPSTAALITVVFVTAFGLKAALFPFFSWLPNSYHTPPTAVAALFAGLLTKVGIYAIIRFVGTIAPTTASSIIPILTIVCVLTIVIGSIGALAHTNLRKILGYLLIGHIAFMLLGLIVPTQDSMAAAYFYMLNHILVITCLFFFVGIIQWHTGQIDIRKIGGLQAKYPALAVGMAIPTLSLIGIPPFSGFWPKIGLLQAAAESPIFFASIIFSSFLTLLAMAKVWMTIFWRAEVTESPEMPPCPTTKALPAYLLAAIILFISIFPAPIADLTNRAANEFAPYFQINGGDQ